MHSQGTEGARSVSNETGLCVQLYFNTTNGPTPGDEVARVVLEDVGEYSRLCALKSTFAFLTIGYRCMEFVYTLWPMAISHIVFSMVGD